MRLAMVIGRAGERRIALTASIGVGGHGMLPVGGQKAAR
jgi:hypothetical protein